MDDLNVESYLQMNEKCPCATRTDLANAQGIQNMGRYICQIVIVFLSTIFINLIAILIAR